MTNFDMPNNIFSMKYSLDSVPGLADVGAPHGDGDGPRTSPRCMGRVLKKFQMTNFDMPNNVSSVKYALKSVPGLADVRVPHEVGDGLITPPRCPVGVRKKFEMTDSTLPRNMSSVKYALKSVPGLADVGVPHGGEDASRTQAQGSGSKITTYHVDQHEKLKGWDAKYLP